MHINEIKIGLLHQLDFCKLMTCNIFSAVPKTYNEYRDGYDFDSPNRFKYSFDVNEQFNKIFNNYIPDFYFKLNQIPKANKVLFIPLSIIELKFSNKFSKHIKPLHVVEGLIMDSKNGIKMTVYIKPMVIECLSDGNDAQEDFEVKMKDYKAGLLKKILDKKKY